MIRSISITNHAQETKIVWNLRQHKYVNVGPLSAIHGQVLSRGSPVREIVAVFPPLVA